LIKRYKKRDVIDVIGKERRKKNGVWVLKNVDCCWHIWFGWETHVKDENVPRQLTVELWKRLQLSTEENFDSKLPRQTSAVTAEETSFFLTKTINDHY